MSISPPARVAFSQPPLDGSHTVPELYDWNYEHNRNYPMFVYEDGPGAVKYISLGEGVQGMHRATLYIGQKFPEISQVDSERAPPVIAILAASDAITFFCTLFGSLRTGATLFLISPRNSTQAISHLLSETKPIGILVSSEASIQQLADDSIKLYAPTGLKKIPMPTFKDLFPLEGFDADFKFVKSASLKMGSPAIIYHSSGTASFPKPISWTHEALFWVSIIPSSGNSEVPGSVMGCHCVPFFHAMGGLPLTVPASVGVILAVFKPQSPAIVPNPVNVFEGSLSTKADFLLSPPTFFELWSQTPEYVDAMSKMKGIVFGGGPLAKHAGDTLAQKGVNVFQIYASTETLLLSEFLPKSPGMNWEYIRFNPNRKMYLEPFGDNQFRVVVIATDHYRPLVVNTVIDGSDAYATDDLVSPHPTEQGLYKIVGRADAQIIHSNGEKTNPGPMESLLDQDPLMHKAIIFGRGRFQCGVLIQPSEGQSVDPSDTSAALRFRNMIWPTVEKANAIAPTHSRIFKEMILIASTYKPFEYTAKGTLRRQRVLETYSSEIDALYSAIEESAQPDICRPDDWTHESILQLTRSIIARTMKRDIDDFGDDADLFEHGLDSLQATWIRNTFARVLRESHPKLVHNLSSNYVYERSTISGISDYIHDSVAGDGNPSRYSIQGKKAELLGLIKKYSGSFPEFIASPRSHSVGRAVLLTGGTGSLGSNILAKLLQNSSVDFVFVLSRPSLDGKPDERLFKAFKKEGLNVELLRSTRLRILEGDGSKDGLGIEIDKFNELLSSVTHVILNGWRVNFRNAVGTFESNIRSVRNFIDFCLRCKGESPARLIFISSIGIFNADPPRNLEPEEPLGIEHINLGFGYGESKWISEMILNEAMASSVSRVTVVRLGQMTGGISGSWNEHEWFPSLIKSSVSLRKLPAMNGNVSWITGDVATSGIIDVLDCEERILHLVHPLLVEGRQIIDWFSRELGIPVVAPEEWIEALEVSVSDTERALEMNPALQLLDVFRSVMRRENGFEPKLASEKTQRVSHALRHAEELGENNVKTWISYWRGIGFL